MDDPIIGLTIYDSKLVKNGSVYSSSNKGSVLPGITVQNSQQLQNNTNKLKFGRPVQSSQEWSEEKKPSLSGECFQCLPGIEDADKDMSSDCSETSSPLPPPGPAEELTPGHSRLNSPPPPQDFWLMRLFQSNLFDMSIAIGYLFNSKEEDVQAYLGNKLFVSSSAYSDVCVWCVCGRSGFPL